MLRASILIGLGLLTACSSEGQKAEERYRIVEKGGTDREKCDAARAVQAAYLQARDQAKYENWKIEADLHCMSADLNARGL